MITAERKKEWLKKTVKFGLVTAGIMDNNEERKNNTVSYKDKREYPCFHLE